jgi:hypothetical protein
MQLALFRPSPSQEVQMMSRPKYLLKATLIGTVSGLAASWMMNQYWAVTSRLEQAASSPNSQQNQQQQEQRQHAPENPTVKVADTVSRQVLHRGLRQSEKEPAGAAVHYAFGAVTGAVYGLLNELAPATGSAFGLAYATAVWLVADEILVPSLRLSAPPDEYPVSKHLEGLGAHLVYGATTEGIRRALRWAA